MTELEQKVLDTINCVTNSTYISTLKVITDDSSYTLKLSLNCDLAPLVLSFEGTEEEFFDFLCKEFRARNLDAVSRWKTLREEDQINWILYAQDR